MTCAWRLAGAHSPAPSSGSPRRPDPRPGRFRARLSRLLPALALLLGGLSLLAAGLAEAQTYSTKIRNLQLQASTNLKVIWDPSTDPGFPDLGYRVQFKTVAAPDASATTANDPNTGWVNVGHTGTDPQFTIVAATWGLKPYTDYRVRVQNKRGTNTYGAWVGRNVYFVPPSRRNIVVFPRSGWTVREGSSIVLDVTGIPGFSAPTRLKAFLDPEHIGQDVWLEFDEVTLTPTRTQFTHAVKVHAHDDGLLEGREEVTGYVSIDSDFDGDFDDADWTRKFTIIVEDADPTPITMTSNSRTVREGAGYVTVTLRAENPDAIPARGWRIQVAATGTASPQVWTRAVEEGQTDPDPGWDYEMHPSQVETWSDGTTQTAAYFHFTPTDHEHTLMLRARGNDGREETETIVLKAMHVGTSGYVAEPLTLTIPGQGGGSPGTERADLTLRLSASPNPVDEGSPVTVTATLSRALSRDVRIPLTVTDVTAEAGDRGTLAAITIDSGATSGTGTIATNEDADSDDETFTVAPDYDNLPGEVTGFPGPITVTIADDDPQQGSGATEAPTVTITPQLYALIQQIEGWRDDPRYNSNRAHVMRWNRVLLAFGWEVSPVSDGSLEPMDAAEAQTYADRGWTRWVAVAAALRGIEGARPVVTIAAGAPVTEGAAAGFTLTAAPAPSANLAVTVSVAQRGAFAQASALGTRTLTIPAGTASTSFTVATVNDSADEADGAVVASVAGGSGYTPGAAARATVAVADNDDGLPGIETKRGIAREGTDDVVIFQVRLGRAAPGTVTVDYATADGAGSWAGSGPARAGADYRATSGTLTFTAGETRKTVSVPILDDAIDEGTEYFLLRFSNPQGATLAAGARETQGLIRNSDPLQAMWLARFGRMVASDAVASVTARLETPRDAGSHVTVAGQRMNFGEADGGEALATVLTGFAQTFGAPSAPTADKDDPFARHRLSNGWNDPAAVTGARRVTARELLLGTSFRAVLGQSAGSQWTSWGQGASVSRFSAAVPGLGLTGEAATGSMGMDYERGRLLMGFAMTHSVGEGSAQDAGWRYALGSTATMAMPYARLALSDRISVWGMAGTGSGTLSLDLDGAVPQSYRTDLAMTLAATGVRGDLLTPAEPGGFALALKADAFWVRTESERVAASEFGSLMGARGESSRVRAMLDGSRTFSFASGAALTPKLELGVRHDAGDAETGTGLEVGAGLGYADPSRALDMALKVHGLAVHAEDGYDEWGVSGQLRLVPGGAGRGLSASLTPSYGVDPAGTQRLWALPASSGLAANPVSGSGAGSGAEPTSRFDAEVGYGMALAGDRLTGTPNVGFGLSDTAREYRMGWRLTSAVRGDPGFEVSLDATRREPANDNGEAEHGVMLRSLIRW